MQRVHQAAGERAEVIMWCMKCNKHLSRCECPDLKERLESLRGCEFIHQPSVVDKPLLENKLHKEQPKPEQN